MDSASSMESINARMEMSAHQIIVTGIPEQGESHVNLQNANVMTMTHAPLTSVNHTIKLHSGIASQHSWTVVAIGTGWMNNKGMNICKGKREN